jgi:hypothetical protein
MHEEDAKLVDHLNNPEEEWLMGVTALLRYACMDAKDNWGEKVSATTNMVSEIKIRSNLERGSARGFRSCKTHPRLISQDSHNNTIVESKS